MIRNLRYLTRTGWCMIVIALLGVSTNVYSQMCGILSNGGFEDNTPLAGWAVSQDGVATIVSDVHSGTKAVRLGTVPSGVNRAGMSPVAAGQTVTLEVWAKLSGSPGWSGVGLDFLDANGNEISEVSVQITSTTYQRYVLNPTVPSGSSFARIWTYKTGSTGYMFLDDFCLTNSDTQPPSVPTGLTASAITATSFTLSWTPSTDNVGVKEYWVKVNGNTIATTANNSFNVTGLTGGTNYFMTVNALDASGNNSGASTALRVTTADSQAPSTPTGLSSSGITQTSFTLSWNASTDNVGVTGYDVFRNGTLLTTVAGTSIPVTGLAAGTTYAMRVRAKDAAGNTSPQSSILNVTTLAATTSCGAITNNGFENGLDGWTNDNGVNATTTDARTGTRAAITGPGRGGLHYGSLVPASGGQTFTVRLYAKTSGNPVWSGYGLDFLDASGTEISGADGTITNGSTYREFTTTGIVPPGTANISLWTYKDGDTGSLLIDDFCLTITGNADTQAPTVPTGLTSSNITSTSFTLSWTASTDAGGSGVNGYEIYRNNTSIGTSTGTSFNVLNLAPATTYSMRVRARDVAGNVSAQSTALNVTTSNGTAPVARVNNMGININGSGGIDYNYDKSWADAMRSHRWINKANNSNATDDANKDANYWPTEDAHILVWHGLDSHDNHGTYRLQFNGSATVTTTTGTIQGMTYNSSTNTSTANLVISDQNNSELFLTFRNTKRTSTSSTNTGVTNIKLMRPTAPGSNTPYSTDKVFTDQFLAAVSKFSTIRFMDFTATNENGDEVWNDRTKWSDARQNPPPIPGREYGWQGRGASWESVIMMANAAGKDAWICVPHKVNEDYITNLARLFRDGNEFTPGLNANLKLYIEYSNEVWNTGGGFGQTQWVNERGSSYGAPLNFDGETNDLTLGQRYKVMMTVRISEIFRSTFGNDQMMTRIRPVLAWNKGWNDLTNRQLSFLDRYYNKRDPRSNRATARPVNYYIWGGGGSTYFNAEGVPTLNQIWESGTYNVTAFYNDIDSDAAFAKVFGLQYVSYEGNSHPQYNGDEEVVNQATLDPRMKNELKEHHYAFNQLDGDLLCYFNMTGLPFGFAAANIEDTNTPKFQAITELMSETPKPVNYGSLAPFSRAGNDTDVFSWYEDQNPGSPFVLEAPDPNDNDPNEAEEEYHSGYTFRVNTTGNYTLQVEYSTTRTATLAVEFNGTLLQSFNLSNTNGSAANTTLLPISCAADKLHGIRLVCTAGAVTIRFIKVNPATSPSVAREAESTISASPNPILSGESIDVSGFDSNASIAIKIVDMSGAVRYEGTVEEGNESHTINTIGLPRGVYILKVTTKENTVNKRIVVE